MADLIAKYFAPKLFFLGWWTITASPLFLLFLVHDPEKIPGIVTCVCVLWAVGSLVSSLWLGNTTAHYLIDDHLMFTDAVKRTWFDGRLRLAFVPIIGTWFTPDEDKTQYDDDDDIRSHRLE